MFRKLFAVILIASAVSAVSAAPPDYNPAFGRSSANYKWSDADNAFVAERTNSDGTTPMTDARGRVGIGVTTGASLSTSTPLLISSIATITLPCVVDVSADCPWIEGEATTTASVVTIGHKRQSSVSIQYVPGVAGWDRGILASTTIGSITVTVYPSVP